jgi:hypothetical protein
LPTETSVSNRKTLHLDKRAHKIVEEGEEHPDDELLDDRLLAEWFGVSDQWPTQARIGGFGPPYIVLGPRNLKYRRDKVQEWLRSRPT